MKVFAVQTLLFFVIAAVPKSGFPQTGHKKADLPAYEDKDGYEVLSVLLNANSKTWKNDVVRIDPRTVGGERVSDIEKACVNTPREFLQALGDFNEKAKRQFAVERKFTLEKEYELDSSGLAYVGAPKDAYRSGIYRLGAVGLDKARTHAVAFIEYRCGIQCGSSLFYLLEKSGNGWREMGKPKPCGWIY